MLWIWKIPICTMKKSAQTLCVGLWTFIAMGFIDTTLFEILRDTHDATRISTEIRCSILRFIFERKTFTIECYYLQTNACLKCMHNMFIYTRTQFTIYFIKPTICSCNGNQSIVYFWITWFETVPKCSGSISFVTRTPAEDKYNKLQ